MARVGAAGATVSSECVVHPEGSSGVIRCGPAAMGVGATVVVGRVRSKRAPDGVGT